jgi:hypothetical protein
MGPIDSSGHYLCKVSGIVAGSTATAVILGPSNQITAAGWEVADGLLSNCFIKEAQLEIGSIASDYSPTTSAAASNPNAGRYSWQPDGANDCLRIPSAPFQNTDDFWIVVACTAAAAGISSGIFSVGNNTNMAELITLAYNTGRAQFYIATGGVTRQVQAAAQIDTAPVVMAARKVGTDCYLYVNGLEVGIFNTVGQPASAFTEAFIGSYTTTLGFFNGAISYAQPGKGTITASQLLTEQRLAASTLPNGPVF